MLPSHTRRLTALSFGTSENHVSESADAYLYSERWLIITAEHWRGFHITVDLDNESQYKAHQVLTADRLGGVVGSFDSELVVHDGIYVSSWPCLQLP